MSARSISTAELFDTYGARLVRRAKRVLGSETEADDAVQEVMLSVLEAPHLLPDVESMLGWLYTLVRRRCVDIIRSDVRRKAREVAAVNMERLFAGADDPAAMMEKDEVIRLVAKAVDELPKPQREIFVANAMEGKTFREISEETGAPPGTLMARKKRAIDAIRRRLKKSGVLPEECSATFCPDFSPGFEAKPPKWL